jgi:hypothetical protein
MTSCHCVCSGTERVDNPDEREVVVDGVDACPRGRLRLRLPTPHYLHGVAAQNLWTLAVSTDFNSSDFFGIILRIAKISEHYANTNTDKPTTIRPWPRHCAFGFSQCTVKPADVYETADSESVPCCYFYPWWNGLRLCTVVRLHGGN